MNPKRLTAWLFFVGFVNSFFSPYVSIALPRISNLFNLSEAHMGWILSSSSVGSIGAGLIGGALTDRFGAKKVLLAGLSLCSLSYIMTGLARGFLGVIIGLILLGCAGGLAWPAGLSLLSSMHQDRRRRVFSLLMVFGAIASIISAPLFSFFLARLPDRWILTAFLLFGLTYAKIVLRLWKEPFPEPNQDSVFNWKESAHLLKNPFLLVVSIMILLHVGADTGLYGWMPTFLDKAFPRPHPFQPGVALSVYSMAYASSRGLIALLPARLPNLPIILISSLAGGTLSFMAVHAAGYKTVVLLYGAAAFSFSWEYIALLAMAGDRFPKNSGTVYGLLNAMGPVGATVCPALMGLVAERTHQLRWSMSLPSAGFWALSAIAMAWLIVSHRRHGGTREGESTTDEHG